MDIARTEDSDAWLPNLGATPAEYSTYFHPQGLDGIEALHARFIEHAYRPHSHPTWTVAVVERGAARFELDATHQRAGEGELFVLEPEAVHTGMAAVPEGWAYKVLYIEPRLVHDWAERDGGALGATGRRRDRDGVLVGPHDLCRHARPGEPLDVP